MGSPGADKEGATEVLMKETPCPSVSTIRAMRFVNLIEHKYLDTFAASMLLTFRALNRLIADALDRLQADITGIGRHCVCD